MIEYEQACMAAKKRLQLGLQCPASAYYLGICSLRGRGLPQDVRMAGWYFRIGADMTGDGALLDHRYADMCRMEILKDSVRLRPMYDPMERARLVQYCDAVCRHGQYAVRIRMIRFLLKFKIE